MKKLSVEKDTPADQNKHKMKNSIMTQIIIITTTRQPTQRIDISAPSWFYDSIFGSLRDYVMNNVPLNFQQKRTKIEWDMLCLLLWHVKLPPHNNHPQRNWYLLPLMILWLNFLIAAYLWYEQRSLKFSTKKNKNWMRYDIVSMFGR